MSISACMIVRDESKVLARCLNSIKDWVDEIIVVDTGSKDNTIEIAESFGAVVFEQPWQDDFSLHRNYSISKATKDWIFVIDADEEVLAEDGLAMKKMLADGIENDVIAVDVLSLYGEEKVARSILPMLRFFRASIQPRYKGAVHNAPVINGNVPVYRIPFRILHYGYDLDKETMEKKYLRVVTMCQKAAEERPEDPLMWLNYCRALKVRDGKFDESQIGEMEKAAFTGIELSGGVNDEANVYIQLLTFMSLVQNVKKNYVGAAHFADMALKCKPDYLDALYLGGFAYTHGVDIRVGESMLRQYLVEQEKYDFSDKLDSLVMEYANYRALIYRELASIEDWKDRQRRNVPNRVGEENANPIRSETNEVGEPILQGR